MPEIKLHVVMDEPSECPYLDGRMARMPLQLPAEFLSRSDLDTILSAGFRRSGVFYYRTACPSCQACEPLRVDVENFQETRSLRRVLKRGDQLLTVEIGSTVADARRIDLFNRHRLERNMARGEGPVNEEEYSSFLVASMNTTLEFRYLLDNQLVAVAVTDFAEQSLSAVYCYFDPQLEHLSLGTYSILKQIELARAQGMKWVYLGMYVAENQHLRYKARYFPHERFTNGSWLRYEVEA